MMKIVGALLCILGKHDYVAVDRSMDVPFVPGVTVAAVMVDAAFTIALEPELVCARCGRMAPEL